MTTNIEISLAPLVTQQPSDRLIAIRDGAIVRATPASFALVATTGSYNDLADKPDIANFESSTQLAERDTQNRSRSNHTGTQPIETITGLQSAVETFTARVVIVTEATYPADPEANVLYVVMPDA